MKIYIYLIAICLYCFGCKQSKINTSISSIDSLYNESKIFVRKDTVKFLALIKKQISQSEFIKYGKGLAKVYYLLAYYYDINHNLGNAAQNYFKCLQYAQEINLEKFIYNALFNLGRIYYLSNEYNKSSFYYEKALEVAKKSNDYQKMFDSYEKIGLCFKKIGKYREAQEIYFEATQVKPSIKTKANLSKLFVLIGITYEELNLIDSSFFYYDKAITTSLGTSVEKNIFALAMDAKGIAFLKLSDTLKAKSMFHQSILTNELNGKQLARVNNNLAEVYHQQDSLEEAIEFYQAAIDVSINREFDRQLIKAHVGLYEIHQSLGNIKLERLHGNYLKANIIPILDLKERLEIYNQKYQLQQLENQQRREKEQTRLLTERVVYSIIFVALIIGASWTIFRWRKYFSKWSVLKDKYNHFANKYNEFLANYQETIAKQLELNRQLGMIADTEIKDPSEYLWRNPKKDDDEKDDEE